jgi:hypothetical protein
MIHTAAKWLIAGTAAALLMVVAIVTKVSVSSTTNVAVNACSTALGQAPTPTSTIADLAGAQAADVAAADPALSTATGTTAAHAVDTLNRLDNWRDLDRELLARWVANPSGAVPAGAVAIRPPNNPSGDPEQMDYGHRCQRALASLSARQRANMAAVPLVSTEQTAASAQIRRAVTAEIQHRPGRALVPLIAHLLGADPAVPQLLWTGSRVAPAALTGGDLVFFDYSSAGPTHVAVALGATTVATTYNLDGHSPGVTDLRAQPIPTANVVIVRPTTPIPDDAKDPR